MKCRKPNKAITTTSTACSQSRVVPQQLASELPQHPEAKSIAGLAVKQGTGLPVEEASIDDGGVG